MASNFFAVKGAIRKSACNSVTVAQAKGPCKSSSGEQPPTSKRVHDPRFIDDVRGSCIRLLVGVDPQQASGYTTLAHRLSNEVAQPSHFSFNEVCADIVNFRKDQTASSEEDGLSLVRAHTHMLCSCAFTGGFRALSKGVSRGFRGVPRVSKVLEALSRLAALGKAYIPRTGAKGFLRLSCALL